MMDTSVIEKINFLNRLSALQNLCSDHDNYYPSCLLFIPGSDGRYNKGSILLLKYLFMGAIGKDLFDDTLDASYDALEEIVILIKQTSVSIIYR
jgi:hypothetical protein